MAKKDLSKASARKFLFDVNNFDEPDEPEIVEPEIPPPPTFNEEELEAARKLAYDNGKKDGLAEAMASREKAVADLLRTVTQNFSVLFAAEGEREARFEGEAVHLARIIFETLFPRLNEQHGLGEVERAIREVLESQGTQPEILIEVRPDYVEEIQAHINKAAGKAQGRGLCTVLPDEKLGPGACRLSWKDGGAARAPENLAEQISRQLEQILADKPRLHDNESSEGENRI